MRKLFSRKKQHIKRRRFHADLKRRERLHFKRNGGTSVNRYFTYKNDFFNS